MYKAREINQTTNLQMKHECAGEEDIAQMKIQQHTCSIPVSPSL